MCETNDKTLDERLRAAGMHTVAEMLHGRLPLDVFTVNAGVNDPESFEAWLQMRYEETLKLMGRLKLNKQESDELFEWVTSHCAVLREVILNYRQATGRPPVAPPLPQA